MQIIVAKLKQEKFQLQIEDNEAVSLLMCANTVADKLKMNAMQAEIMAKEDEQDFVKMTKIGLSRLVCSVKNTDGSYFWQSIEDESLALMPDEAILALTELNNKVNPLEQKDLSAKKKKS